jgi:hypothetical protein
MVHLGRSLEIPLASFLGSRSCWYPHVLDALMMEALACRDGMLLAEREVMKLILETDNQELVSLWARGDNQRSCLAPILREIREISSCFIDFNLLHASRVCNCIAHKVAQQATDDHRVVEWHVVPTCIINLLAEECNPHIP